MIGLLIRAFSTYHRDPDKNRKGCYKRGDPVIAKAAETLWTADGRALGRCEQLPRFWRIQVPTELWSAEEYVTEHFHNTLQSPVIDRQATSWMRRRYQFNPGTLSLSQRAALTSNYVVTLTWKEFRATMVVKDPAQTRYLSEPEYQAWLAWYWPAIQGLPYRQGVQAVPIRKAA